MWGEYTIDSPHGQFVIIGPVDPECESTNKKIKLHTSQPAWVTNTYRFNLWQHFLNAWKLDYKEKRPKVINVADNYKLRDVLQLSENTVIVVTDTGLYRVNLIVQKMYKLNLTYRGWYLKDLRDAYYCAGRDMLYLKGIVEGLDDSVIVNIGLKDPETTVLTRVTMVTSREVENAKCVEA